MGVFGFDKDRKRQKAEHEVGGLDRAGPAEQNRAGRPEQAHRHKGQNRKARTPEHHQDADCDGDKADEFDAHRAVSGFSNALGESKRGMRSVVWGDANLPCTANSPLPGQQPGSLALRRQACRLA